MTISDRPDDGALVTQARGIAADFMRAWSKGTAADGYLAGAYDETVAMQSLITALASTPANTAEVAPDGWKLVPIEPTQDMLDGLGVWNLRMTDEDKKEVWADFLAASPAQVASAPDRAGVDVERLTEERAYFERGFICAAAWAMTKRDDAVLSDAVIEHAWAHRDEGMDAEDMLPPIRSLAALSATPSREGEVEKLREHISEQIQHAETRIADGISMGATIWRIALEDIVRENRAALATKPEN